MGEQADKIRKKAQAPAQKAYTPINTDLMISTGSTLLDLAISGGRVRGGGIPGGIIVEFYGPSSSGKTALLVELCASAQDQGGDIEIDDPEARLDQEYAKLYGLQIPKDHYYRSDTVADMFKRIEEWEPKNEGVINVYGGDSIAALSTDLEMSEKGDKMGMRKAKDLSTWCRRVCRKIASTHKLVALTNQERDSGTGKKASGGNAIPFHASLRIRVSRVDRIEKEKTFKSEITKATGTKRDKLKTETKEVKVKKTIGIVSNCLIKKSSIDDEYRVVPVYIIFGFGIDDVRANLQWYKDMTKNTMYVAVDKDYQQMDAAIAYIEENNLEGQLREMVIDLWEGIEAKFKTTRKKKVRF
jgi:RecA/RadA recombinase